MHRASRIQIAVVSYMAATHLIKKQAIQSQLRVFSVYIVVS